jgi:hypothetical protein
MRKIKAVAAVLAMVAGSLVFAAGPAHAVASGYTWSEIDRCAFTSVGNVCFSIDTWTTNTSSQIWINGHVQCTGYSNNGNPTPHITWCGIGVNSGPGSNGSNYLNVGANFTLPAATGSYYERMNIKANAGGCETFGSNTQGHGVQGWYNDEAVICESHTSGSPDVGKTEP